MSSDPCQQTEHNGFSDSREVSWVVDGHIVAGSGMEAPASNALELLPNGFPSVSVVIPCYNSARYIVERLRSVVWQSWPIQELVVLDDASTDETMSVVAEIQQSWGVPLLTVENDLNSGSPCRQWSKAMSFVTGELVWIAEADDVAHPELLATLVPAFHESRVALAYVNTMIIDDHGCVLYGDTREWLGGKDPDIWNHPFTMAGDAFLVDLLAPRNVIINVSGVLFRREVLTASLQHLQQPLGELRTAGDWLVYADCLSRGDVVFSPKTFNACRRHQASLSFQLNPLEHFRETLKVQAHIAKAINLDDDAWYRMTSAAYYLAGFLEIDAGVATRLVQHVLGTRRS